MTGRPRWWGRPALRFLLDVVLVIAFAALGVSSHAEDLTAVGILATATPFVVGTAVGWLVVRLRSGTWPLRVGPGVTVWFSTVVVGMVLRVSIVGSFAWPFLGVAAAVLALLLVGSRLVLRSPGTDPAGR